MDPQLASVLTSGSLDVQNGSQCSEASGPVTDVYVDPKDKTPTSCVAGNLQPGPVRAAVTIRKDVSSINGKKPEGGGTSKPASQETRKIGGFRQPITVKAGVPVLRSHPIRIKIVVPSRCQRPITNSANSLTKDFARSRSRPVLVSAGSVIRGRNARKTQIAAVKEEEASEEVTREKPGESGAESFHEAGEGAEAMCKQKRVADAELTQNALMSTNTHEMLGGIKEETTEREMDKNKPPLSLEPDLEPAEVEMEQQTEPLDLSLPKRRESRRFLEDSGVESSLIMEVDEYEGEGDRDVVEEDDDDEGLRLHPPNALEDSVLSPFLSTSFLPSLSSVDCDTENLLLIDDRGIPYTLSPDGLKVPQVDASAAEEPRSDQAEVDGNGSTQSADPDLSQSSDNALSAPPEGPQRSPSPAAASLSPGVDPTNEAFTSGSDPSELAETSVRPAQEAKAVLAPCSGVSVPGQPIQILTNHTTNPPILLLSPSSSSPAPQLSSAPVGLSLPLSVTQPSPAASAPVFLLLSSVPSTDSTSTSTPIAILDPTTGQVSQITTASAPASVALPFSAGQGGAMCSPLPTLPHPVIRLSANNAPVILSGVNNINSGSVLTSLTIASPAPTLQSAHPNTTPVVPAQINSSSANPGTEAIPAEEVSHENDKPSALAASSPLTYDPLAEPSSEAEAQSPASECEFDPSDPHYEHLPLDDHLYFSQTAPSSPPIGSLLPTAKLDPLSPLDSLSPAGSPSAVASRRVLYCQLCPRVFFYLSDLERHAITHSQKKPHVCQQCGKAFKRSSHLQRHKHIHTGQRNFVCPICTKRFREAGELQRHQRVHTGEKPYQCQLCHTRFAERNTLRRHTKRKHPYHQVAMEMLSERQDRGGGGDGGGSGAQEEEESAEWYSSTVSNLENSESEMEA